MQYFSVHHWPISQLQSVSYFTKSELKMAELSAGNELKQAELTVVLTEFSLCSAVTVGLSEPW